MDSGRQIISANVSMAKEASLLLTCIGNLNILNVFVLLRGWKHNNIIQKTTWQLLDLYDFQPDFSDDCIAKIKVIIN